MTRISCKPRVVLSEEMSNSYHCFFLFQIRKYLFLIRGDYGRDRFRILECRPGSFHVLHVEIRYRQHDKVGLKRKSLIDTIKCADRVAAGSA